MMQCRLHTVFAVGVGSLVGRRGFEAGVIVAVDG